MNMTNLISTLATGYSKTTLFPFPFHLHLGFCAIALVFFIIMYSRKKRPYQLIFAIAIPLTLAIWLSNSKTLFNIIGIAEVLLILLAAVLTMIENKKNKASSAQTAPAVSEPEKEEASTENSTEDKAE